MVPLATTAQEIALCKAEIDSAAVRLWMKLVYYFYLVGTMVELPRASICADELAIEADSFPLARMISLKLRSA